MKTTTTTWSSLTGVKYYHLTVIYPMPKPYINCWRCSCVCGNLITVSENDLKSGTVSSCGCLPPITKSSKNYKLYYFKHGMTCTAEHNAWVNMKNRCLNKNNKSYPRHGGRGVAVCDRWLHSFENFYADVGQRPDPRMVLALINKCGNYEPGNCQWQYRNGRTL